MSLTCKVLSVPVPLYRYGNLAQEDGERKYFLKNLSAGEAEGKPYAPPPEEGDAAHLFPGGEKGADMIRAAGVEGVGE